MGMNIYEIEYTQGCAKLKKFVVCATLADVQFEFDYAFKDSDCKLRQVTLIAEDVLMRGMQEIAELVAEQRKIIASYENADKNLERIKESVK